VRTYKRSGRAVFLCEGHPAHADAGADGAGHHMIAIAWAAGCTHIDDHAEPVLRGCEQGCTAYVLVDGDDPIKAETEDKEA
jgi:hypothetical protein